MAPEVACVTVFYNPDATAITTVRTLATSDCPVVVVVNQASAAQIAALTCLPNVSLIHNAANLGLATALNQGLGFAFDELGARYVLALDQDSTPDPLLPQALARELEARCDEPIACLGPTLWDRKSGQARYAYDQPDVARTSPSPSPRSIPTSGSLFTRRAWREVGPMLDALFIDDIDHEWCFRASARGYGVLVSTDVTMPHNMGDTGITVFGRFKPIHRSPLRHYYIVRNTLFLCSLDYVPWRWKLAEFFKTFRRMVVYGLVSTDRWLSLRLMARAWRDGLLGRLGPCPISHASK